MKVAKKMMLLSVAGLILAAMADNASAQVVINGAGSSAGRQFAGDAPVAMCLNLNGLTTPKPVHLRSGTNDSGSNQHTWICNITYNLTGVVNFVNQPVVIRYSASESGDGFTRLTGQYSSPLTALYISDVTKCNVATLHEVTSGGVTFDEYNSCTADATLPVNYGASDVEAAAFGQTAPGGATPISFPPAGQLAVDDSTLSTDVIATLPFALFVNNGVRQRNHDNSVGPAITNLSRSQIEAIFRNNVKSWDSLGYGVIAADGDTSFSANSGISLCLREAGSGTLSAFARSMMLQSQQVAVANNTVNGTGGLITYSNTSGGVTSCIANNTTGRGGIGYLNAESTVANAHTISINGASSNYPASGVVGASPIERKRDVACGRYEFWSKWRMLRITANDTVGGTAQTQNQLIRVLGDAARIRTNNVPSGTHWVSEAEQNVSKTTTLGPITFNGTFGNVPANPECRP